MLVHLRRVRDLLVGVARHAGLREHLEPGARVAERPGGQLDGLLGQCLEGAGTDVGHGFSPFEAVTVSPARRMPAVEVDVEVLRGHPVHCGRDEPIQKTL